eukprot:scaffold160144_cov32-Prasinocladus_malaysianus.AAC.1
MSDRPTSHTIRGCSGLLPGWLRSHTRERSTNYPTRHVYISTRTSSAMRSATTWLSTLLKRTQSRNKLKASTVVDNKTGKSIPSTASPGPKMA